MLIYPRVLPIHRSKVLVAVCGHYRLSGYLNSFTSLISRRLLYYLVNLDRLAFSAVSRATLLSLKLRLNLHILLSNRQPGFQITSLLFELLMLLQFFEIQVTNGFIDIFRWSSRPFYVIVVLQLDEIINWAMTLWTSWKRSPGRTVTGWWLWSHKLWLAARIASAWGIRIDRLVKGLVIFATFYTLVVAALIFPNVSWTLVKT